MNLSGCIDTKNDFVCKLYINYETKYLQILTFKHILKLIDCSHSKNQRKFY